MSYSIMVNTSGFGPEELSSILSRTSFLLLLVLFNLFLNFVTEIYEENMEIIRKGITVHTEQEYFTKHLQIVNQLLPTQMTHKEVEVLAAFMALDGDIVKKNRFGTTARKIVMAKLTLSPGGLGNYLKALKVKGFIYLNEFDSLQLRDYLDCAIPSQGYQIKIKMEKNEAG